MRESQPGYNKQQPGSSMNQLFLKILKLYKYRDPRSTSVGRDNAPKLFKKVLNCVNIVTHTPHQVAVVHQIVDFQPPIKTKDEEVVWTTGPSRQFGSTRWADKLTMSVFMDLNVCYTPDRNRLKSLVEAAANRESPAWLLPNLR